MSGLAALLLRDGRPAEAAPLRAMLAAIPYRGPDGATIYVQGNVGLGHALNRLTPEDAGVSQPLVSPRTGCVVIADARLDDRARLVSRLPERVAPGLSDAELILRGYEAWGSDVVRRVLGDFAVVIWDPRRQELVCARDARGQRSLFYRDDGRTFAAASEIHQLFQDPAVPIAPSEERIRASLLPVNVYRNEPDEAQTFFEGIFAVPAGHVMLVGPAGRALRRYWSLTPFAELRYRRDDEYAEHFLAMLSEAVRDRLRTTEPVGVLLSGGLDSSAVACVAQGPGRPPGAPRPAPRSYSLVFDTLDCDETELIHSVQQAAGIEGRLIDAGAATGSVEMEAAGFLESPNVGARTARDIVFAAAERDGIRVLLTGAAADACVYGSRLVFDALLRQGKLRALWRHFRAFRRVSEEPLRTTIALSCVGPLLPLGLQRRLMAAYTRRMLTRHGERLVPSWVAEPLRGELVRRNLALCVAVEQQRRVASPARHEELRLLDPPEVTRHPAPWRIELWHPFADRRLQEFLLAIPPDQKFAPHPETDEFYAGSKRLLRRALRGILPEPVRTRTTKTIFSAWVDDDVRRQWPAYERLFGPSARSLVAARGYVDQARLFAGLDGLRRGVDRADRIWLMKIIGLEIWLRSLELPRVRLTAVAPPAWERPSRPALAASG